MLNNLSNNQSISKAILGQLTLDSGNMMKVKRWQFTYKNLKFEQRTFWAWMSDADILAIVLAPCLFWLWPFYLLFGNRWGVQLEDNYPRVVLSRRDSWVLSQLVRKLRREASLAKKEYHNKVLLRKMGFDV